MAIDVEIRRGLEGLESLEAEWETLAGNAGNGGFEQSPGAFQAALRFRLDDPSAARFVVLREDTGGLVGICPLVQVKRRIRRLGFPAWDLPRDPDRPTSCFALAGEAPVDALAGVVAALSTEAAHPCLLTLPRVEERSLTWELLKQASPKDFFAIPSGSAIRVPTDGDAMTRIEALSQKFRQNLRRGWRMLEEQGRTDYRVARDAPDVASALERFLVLEAAGWKGRSAEGHAIINDPALLAYVRGTSALLASRQQCEVHELRIGDSLVASLICFLGSAEAYAFKIAYEESLHRAAPGHLLLQRVLETYSSHLRIRALAGGPEAAWWSPWRPRMTPLYSVYVGLGGPRSRLAMALLKSGRNRGGS